MPAVQCYYVNNTGTFTTNSSFNLVLQSLASAIVGRPTGAAEVTSPAYTTPGGTLYTSVMKFLDTNDAALPSDYPRAYLNWILLDDQFNYVSASSGTIPAANFSHPANQMNPVAPGGPTGKVSTACIDRFGDLESDGKYLGVSKPLLKFIQENCEGFK
jgi:hypothetical protein